jgi:hypothetical protein
MSIHPLRASPYAGCTPLPCRWTRPPSPGKPRNGVGSRSRSTGRIWSPFARLGLTAEAVAACCGNGPEKAPPSGQSTRAGVSPHLSDEGPKSRGWLQEGRSAASAALYRTRWRALFGPLAAADDTDLSGRSGRFAVSDRRRKRPGRPAESGHSSEDGGEACRVPARGEAVCAWRDRTRPGADQTGAPRQSLLWQEGYAPSRESSAARVRPTNSNTDRSPTTARRCRRSVVPSGLRA